MTISGQFKVMYIHEYILSDVNLNATKGGMVRVVEASVFALMAAIVIMLLVHVTVLQDGRYIQSDYLSHSNCVLILLEVCTYIF